MSAKIITICLILFVCVMGIGVVGAVECNGDLSNIGNGCSFSTSSTLNGTYTIYANSSAFGGAITLVTNNTFLDCNNTLIVGNGSSVNSAGIIANSRTNVTIKNCRVMNYTWGVFLNIANESLVTNSSFYNNTQYDVRIKTGFYNIINSSSFIGLNWSVYGVDLDTTCYGNNITNNNFNNHYASVFSQSNSNATFVLNNVIRNNYAYGIVFFNSSLGKISGNNITNVSDQDGIRLTTSSQANVIENNRVINTGNITKTTGAGIFIDQYSIGNVVSNNWINNTGHNGISARASNLTIYNNFMDYIQHHGLDFNTCADHQTIESGIAYNNTVIRMHEDNLTYTNISHFVYTCNLTNANIYNNTFQTATDIGILFDSGTENVSFYNNLINNSGSNRAIQFTGKNITSHGNTIINSTYKYFFNFNTNSSYWDYLNFTSRLFQGFYNYTNGISYFINANNTNTYSLTAFQLSSPSFYNGTLTSGTILTNGEANLTLSPGSSIYVS